MTIIKDEQEYLEEFIDYHIKMGIDHIFVFEDLNSKSHKGISDKYPNVTLMSVLDVYNEDRKKDIVIMRNSTIWVLQKKYIVQCLTYIKDNYDYDWCFVLDCDEYITLEDKGQTIVNIFEQFKDYEAVVIQWENYGANNIIFKPDYKDKGIVDTYTKVGGFQENDRPISLTKCAYNMHLYNYERHKNLHIDDLNIKWCKPDFSTDLERKVYNKIYLRHYITKSWEEYVWKLYVRGMFYVNHRKYDHFFEINKDMEPRKDELMGYVDIILDKYK